MGVDTYGEKLKAIQLHILKTRWLICKADAHILPLANKLENNTLLKVEAEVLVVTQVAMLPEVKVQTLARL